MQISCATMQAIQLLVFLCLASQKHLRTKVTPDFHITYSKNGGNLGLESKLLKVKIFDISP